jgi:hypothetical protein
MIGHADEQRASERAIGRAIEHRAALEAGADMHPFVAQRHIVIFKTRPRGLENLEMGCAVNAVDVPVFSGDRHHVLARGRSVQRRCAREIPVMFVARNSLVMPVQPAGRRVDGNEGVGVDGVAWIVRGDVAVAATIRGKTCCGSLRTGLPPTRPSAGFQRSYARRRRKVSEPVRNLYQVPRFQGVPHRAGQRLQG